MLIGYSLGDLTAVTDPLGRTSTRFVDNAGRLVSTISPLGQLSRREYDALSRVVSTTDPQGGRVTFTYDANGNLLTVSDARNNPGSPSTTTYTYDSLDRLLTRTDPPTTTNPSGKTETYHNDGPTDPQPGELTRFADRRNKTTTYCYDELHRRTFAGFGTISVPGACSTGSNYESTIQYDYDAGNRLRHAIDSATGTVERQYDDVNRKLTEITPQGTVSYQYDAAGRRSSMTATGQSHTAYLYDDANRLQQISQGSLSASFGYDLASRRTTLTLPNGVSVTYGYDNAGQLTSLDYKQNASSVGSLTYGYDNAGQRTSQSGLVNSVTPTTLPAAMTGTTIYDAANRLQVWNGTPLHYDANGNLDCENWNSGTSTCVSGATAYTWNARNQLASVAQSATTTSFAYDALGRRQSRTVGTSTTSFLYDGLNPIQEQVSGSATATMLTGLGIDEYFARTESTTTRSLLADALGSTVALMPPSGTATEYSYEPFGKTATSGVTITSNPFQFTGREQDGTGAYHFRARYYHPTFQRFISEDPFEFSGGDANLYSYAGNAPTGYRDPLGLDRMHGLDCNVRPGGAGCSDSQSPDGCWVFWVEPCLTFEQADALVGGGLLGGGLGGGAAFGGIRGGGNSGAGAGPEVTISNGIVITLPPGYQYLGPTTNARGVAYQLAGCPGNGCIVRIMGPGRNFPSGYIRITDRSGTYIDVNGNQVSTSDPAGHIPANYPGQLPFPR
ncbi:MAG TPA: RHS repeat-associated core domain-containing protein [Chloroflexota bacterium]